MDRRILVIWFLALALITFREFKHPAPDAIIVGLPRPWAYGGASIAFAGAALLSEANGPFGLALGAAWLIAIYLGYLGAPSGKPVATTNTAPAVKVKG